MLFQIKGDISPLEEAAKTSHNTRNIESIYNYNNCIASYLQEEEIKFVERNSENCDSANIEDGPEISKKLAQNKDKKG